MALDLQSGLRHQVIDLLVDHGPNHLRHDTVGLNLGESSVYAIEVSFHHRQYKDLLQAQEPGAKPVVEVVVVVRHLVGDIGKLSLQ
jgi:hypothetical protein